MPKVSKNYISTIEQIKKDIGKRIAKIRKERGLTQKELAEKIQINRTLITDYEIGRVRIYADIISKIAEALNISADEILGIKTKNNNNTKLSLRLIRRLQKIEELNPADQKALLRTIDNFLKGSQK